VTEGIKGKQGFQPTIKREDIISVLEAAENPLKNSTVLEELKILDPETYGEIKTAGGVKKVLLKMLKAGEISGGKDPEVGIYLWTVKKEDKKGD
jgi:hypothetical protein